MPLFLHHLFMFCLRNQLSHSCISSQMCYWLLLFCYANFSKTVAAMLSCWFRDVARPM
uniref:Uncharacterized protein n=1 Tax=Triticum urartu TaxID=4572 RepID=A0A8R7JW41_TRIUA